jgi:putative glycosyltransferase
MPAAKLSIVTTMFRSADFVPEFYERVRAAAERVCNDYEIIFVNDGSPDQSLAIARAIGCADHRVKVVDLSRNFGHHHAIVAGLSQAHGERVFLLDVDLEESPEWLLDFWQKFDASDVDVVYGVAATRAGNPIKAFGGSIFYKIFNRLSDTKITANSCTVRLMSFDYVRALLTLPDRNLFLAGNFEWTGFRQVSLTVPKLNRLTTTYTLSRRLALAVTAITSFTAYPLTLIFLFGLFIAALAGLVGLALLADKLLHPYTTLVGWPSVMASIWFLGGTTICVIGVVGIYVSRIFVEVKGRPQYLIRKIYDGYAEPVIDATVQQAE